MDKLCELEEHRILSLLQVELEQWRRKAFVDHHRKGNEKEFGIGKPVLVFQFRWTGPYWITKEFKGSYKLGTLAGEIVGKWVNGFRLKQYKGPMLANPFKILDLDDEITDAETGDTRDLSDATDKASDPERAET